MSIKDELLTIQSASEDNILHAEHVVAWAKDRPNSALFAAIEWDDERAASAHRLWQVRRLIAVHVVSTDGAPQMVSLTIDRKDGGGYRSISDVSKAPNLRAIMLSDALDELERFQLKYQRVQELAAIWDEADRVRAQTAQRRKRAA